MTEPRGAHVMPYASTAPLTLSTVILGAAPLCLDFFPVICRGRFAVCLFVSSGMAAVITVVLGSREGGVGENLEPGGCGARGFRVSRARFRIGSLSCLFTCGRAAVFPTSP